MVVSEPSQEDEDVNVPPASLILMVYESIETPNPPVFDGGDHEITTLVPVIKVVN